MHQVSKQHMARLLRLLVLCGSEALPFEACLLLCLSGRMLEALDHELCYM